VLPRLAVLVSVLVLVLVLMLVLVTPCRCSQAQSALQDRTLLLWLLLLRMLKHSPQQHTLQQSSRTGLQKLSVSCSGTGGSCVSRSYAALSS
jgi:hypothetical protein